MRGLLDTLGGGGEGGGERGRGDPEELPVGLPGSGFMLAQSTEDANPPGLGLLGPPGLPDQQEEEDAGPGGQHGGHAGVATRGY